MGFFGGGSRGRTDAGANRRTATKIGVGNINEKGKKTKSNPVSNFIRGGGVTGAVIRGTVKVGKAIKEDFTTRKTNTALLGTSDYQGGKTFSSSTNTNTGGGNDNNNQPQGIELAKAATSTATVKGPGEIQKEAANNVKGPTTTEMSADQIALANKRKGRRSTNITAKKTLAKNYKLSEKTLLG